jgi:hypothetical protein
MSDPFDLDRLGDIPDPLGASARTPQAESAAAPPLSGGASPTRPELERRRRLAMVVAAVWFAGLAALLGVKSDFGGPLVVLLNIGLPAAIGAAALYAALSPGRIGLGTSVPVTLALAVGGPLAFALLGLLALPHGPSEPSGLLACGYHVIGLGLIPIGLVTWSQRRTAVVGASFRGTLVAVGLGLTAAAMQALHCPNNGAVHVVVGHGWPVIVFGLAGYFYLRRVMRVS